MTSGLDHAVALVTGAVGGLGGAICRTLRDAGAKLALVDLDPAELARVAADLGGDQREVAAFAADLSDDEQTAALPDRVCDRLGRLDVVVNNAGVRQIAPVLETTPADWRRTLDVDLTAPFVLTRAALPGMIAQGRGKIVNIASVAGHQAIPDRAAYCVAKSGVIMLTKAVTMEYGAQGIWCNAVAPGVVRTPMTRVYSESAEALAGLKAVVPMARWGEPEDIAAAVAFLSGDASDYVNGTTLFVDGGWTAGKGF